MSHLHTLVFDYTDKVIKAVYVKRGGSTEEKVFKLDDPSEDTLLNNRIEDLHENIASKQLIINKQADTIRDLRASFDLSERELRKAKEQLALFRQSKASHYTVPRGRRRLIYEFIKANPGVTGKQILNHDWGHEGDIPRLLRLLVRDGWISRMMVGKDALQNQYYPTDQEERLKEAKGV